MLIRSQATKVPARNSFSPRRSVYSAGRKWPGGGNDRLSRNCRTSRWVVPAACASHHHPHCTKLHCGARARADVPQDQTINRLLRAQTGRSRAKLDVPSPGDDTPGTGSRYASPSRRASGAPKSDMIRWVSSIQDDKVVIRVGAPAGKEEWIKLASLDDAPSEAKPQHRNTRGTCGVRGCSQSRKYRSVKRFEVGGCCMEHLKKVEASLA